MTEAEKYQKCPLCEDEIPDGLPYHLKYRHDLRVFRLGEEYPICIACGWALHKYTSWNQGHQHFVDNHPYEEFEKLVALLSLGQC